MVVEGARVVVHDAQTEETVGQLTSLAVVRLKRAVELFQARFADSHVRERLARANVIVSITVTDLENAGITLLMNCPTARVEAYITPDRPDVKLYMTTADLERMFDEGEYLALKILSDQVKFEGQVRKFLRVLPILRGAAPSSA